jgi:tRNA threonylcarbamoyladenosine biosynthesis protein TsaE
MSAGHSLSLCSASPERTCSIAQTLALQLRGGDVVLLSGDVGAGKTHFARCAIHAMLRKIEDVPSPTYTLIQTYESQTAEIWHADLYRVTDITEIEELGLVQAFDEAICLVEWSDRLGELAPNTALSLTLNTTGDHSREITFRWSDPRWEKKLEALLHVGA